MEEEFAPGAFDDAGDSGSESGDADNHVLPDNDAVSEWAKKTLVAYAEKYHEAMITQLHSESPNWKNIKKVFERVNEKIRIANESNDVDKWEGMLPTDYYEQNCTLFWAWTNSDECSKASIEEKWGKFFNLRGIFHRFNRQYYLPLEWTIPIYTMERTWGKLPPGWKEPSYDDDIKYANPAAANPTEESSNGKGPHALQALDALQGLDALEGRMREEYTSLSRGTVLYWWTVGTGTQIFVRYERNNSPIYRVQAGSSMPWNPVSTEQVLSNTPGNSKWLDESQTGETREKWRKSRQDVLDIKGVGWKVEGDDEVGGNSLALIRPVKDAFYPHTRVYVQWKGKDNFSLERRGFVRRIANGSSLNGDRMIYLKAREMENAYWGTDVEAYDEESSEDESSSSDESDYPRTRSRRKKISERRTRSDKKHRKSKRRTRSARKDNKRRTRSAKNDISSSESDSSEESDIEAEKRKRQVKWKKGEAKQKKDPDSDEELRILRKRIEQLELKKKPASSGRSRRHKA
ncbi:uncharacterized protein BDV14DRAFT_204556 [Aspergillus stella-maris]|uniref:uncharacterized protein n=1 Tax=Aspergillus stella-maris TaxID=1810926 RepID=UPI003CCDF0CD